MRCYAQRSPAIARNYEKVRCGSEVHKNCQDVTAYAAGSLQEGTWAFYVQRCTHWVADMDCRQQSYGQLALHVLCQGPVSGRPMA